MNAREHDPGKPGDALQRAKRDTGMTESPKPLAIWTRRAAGAHPRLFSTTYRFAQALIPALVLAAPNVAWAAAHLNIWVVFVSMVAAIFVTSSVVALGAAVIHVDEIGQLIKPIVVGIGGVIIPIAVTFEVTTEYEQQPLWSVVLSILSATWTAFWLAAWPSHREVSKACYARRDDSRSGNVGDGDQTTNEGGDSR